MSGRFSPTSLRGQLSRTWLFLGLGVLGAAIGLLAGLALVDQRGQNRRILDDLLTKAPMVARRVSSELLLGPNGSVQAIVSTLRDELRIQTIIVLEPNEQCSAGSRCGRLMQDQIWAQEKVPYVGDSRHVVVSQQRARFRDSINFGLALVACLPLFLLAKLGMYFQLAFVRRKLLKPLDAMIESGASGDDVEQWPDELRTLSAKLQKVLRERDEATNEAQLLRAQAFLSDLSERILHDLRSPLSTLDLMITNELGNVSSDTKDGLRRVLGRVRGIVNFNLKEYSAQSLVQPALEPPSCSVVGVVRTILEEEAPKAEARGILLMADVPKAASSAFAPIHFTELGRVVSNLIGNAMDAAAEKGKKIHLTLQTGQQFCELSIRDYGPGFEPEVLQRLNSGDRATTKNDGRGIGVFTSKETIQRIGGELTLRSLTDGALVTIRIPLAPTPEWFYDISRSRSERIVALDDDVRMRDRLASAFPSKRVDVFETESEFLKEASQDSNALLLVDYDFGGQRNGIEVILGQGLTRQAVLFSGRVGFDSKVRAFAERNEIRIYPKECLV